MLITFSKDLVWSKLHLCFVVYHYFRILSYAQRIFIFTKKRLNNKKIKECSVWKGVVWFVRENTIADKLMYIPTIMVHKITPSVNYN